MPSPRPFSSRRLLPVVLLGAALAACNISDPAADGPLVGGGENNGSGSCDGGEEDCPPCDITTPYFVDTDGDGFGSAAERVEGCEGLPPDGYVVDDGDCDDDDPQVHPGAAELCNGGDDNCDGAVDEGCEAFVDGDGDGYCATLPEAGPAPAQCLHGGIDCDDASAGVHPGAAQLCGAVDADCDGQAPVARLGAPTFLRAPDSTGANAEVTARRGDDFAVAWVEEREQSAEIRVALLGVSGALKTAPITVSPAHYLSSRPQIVYDPGTDRFAVTFLVEDPELGQGLYVARVSPDGLLDGEITRVSDSDGVAAQATAAGDGKLAVVFDDTDDQGEPLATYARIDVATLTAETVRGIAPGLRVDGASLAYTAEPADRSGTLAMVRAGYRNDRQPTNFYHFISFHADDGSVRQPLAEHDASAQGTAVPYLLSIDDELFLTYRTSNLGVSRLHLAPINPATGEATSIPTTLVDDLQWRSSPVAFGRMSADVFGLVYPTTANELNGVRLDRSTGWTRLSTATFAEAGLDADLISPLYTASGEFHVLDRQGTTGLFKWIHFHPHFGYGSSSEPVAPLEHASPLQSNWAAARRDGEEIEVLQVAGANLETYTLALDGSIAESPTVRATTRPDCLLYDFFGDTVGCETLELSEAPCSPLRRHRVVHHAWDTTLYTWTSTPIGELFDAILADGTCVSPAGQFEVLRIGETTFFPYTSAVDGASEFRTRSGLAVFGPTDAANGGLLGDHTTGTADGPLSNVATHHAAAADTLGYVSVRESFTAGESSFHLGVVGVDGQEVAAPTSFAQFSGWSLPTRPWLSGMSHVDGYFVAGISRPGPVDATEVTEIYLFEAATGAPVGEPIVYPSTLRRLEAAGVDGMVVVTGLAGHRPVMLTIEPSTATLLGESGADLTTRFIGNSFLSLDSEGAHWLFRDGGGRLLLFGGACAAMDGEADDEAAEEP